MVRRCTHSGIPRAVRDVNGYGGERMKEPDECEHGENPFECEECSPELFDIEEYERKEPQRGNWNF